MTAEGEWLRIESLDLEAQCSSRPPRAGLFVETDVAGRAGYRWGRPASPRTSGVAVAEARERPARRSALPLRRTCGRLAMSPARRAQVRWSSARSRTRSRISARLRGGGGLLTIEGRRGLRMKAGFCPPPRRRPFSSWLPRAALGYVADSPRARVSAHYATCFSALRADGAMTPRPLPLRALRATPRPVVSAPPRPLADAAARACTPSPPRTACLGLQPKARIRGR